MTTFDNYIKWVATIPLREAKSASHKALHELSNHQPGPWPCQYCGALVTCVCICPSGDNPHHIYFLPPGLRWASVDHVIPTTRGGSEEIDNKVPACPPCNASKGNRLWPEEWLPGVDMNEVTFVYRIPMKPQPGDDLEMRGLISVLGDLSRIGRYNMTDIEKIAKHSASRVRKLLRALHQNGRVDFQVDWDGDKAIGHEFMAVTA